MAYLLTFPDPNFFHFPTVDLAFEFILHWNTFLQLKFFVFAVNVFFFLLSFKELEENDYLGSDIDTRRRGASDFVRALCRRFEGPVTGILSNVITSFLEECARDLSASWLKKDVIYCLVTAIATKTETARFGATSTSDLVSSWSLLW